MAASALIGLVGATVAYWILFRFLSLYPEKVYPVSTSRQHTPLTHLVNTPINTTSWRTQFMHPINAPKCIHLIKTPYSLFLHPLTHILFLSGQGTISHSVFGGYVSSYLRNAFHRMCGYSIHLYGCITVYCDHNSHSCYDHRHRRSHRVR